MFDLMHPWLMKILISFFIFFFYSKLLNGSILQSLQKY